MFGDQQPVNPSSNLNQRLDVDFAVEAAGLGVWEVDQTTNQVIWDDRCRALFGLAKDNLLPYEQAITYIHPEDVARVDQAVAWAINPESDGTFDQTYRTVGADDGQLRWVRFIGKASFLPTGQIVRYAGVAQDVTQQMSNQHQLEERTQELELVNEKLTVINEEMLATNRLLEVANDDLVRSNQNLEQFAYIASHDLQEPLRKIQQFGDLLLSQHGAMPDEGVAYLQRIQHAASRMSTLIRDLLTFSRISTRQAITHTVNLNETINQVLDSLSVIAEESQAQLTVDPLPTVLGDESQLQQLFQNLLSNALKFRRKTSTGEAITPQITLRSQLVLRSELSPSLQPSRYAEAYHLIEIADNGIGFEEKYLDRIFQVFQRLHGQNEFAGTGVGLAIVQKVVTNHGGAITAYSQTGQGATFCVYLPA